MPVRRRPGRGPLAVLGWVRLGAQREIHRFTVRPLWMEATLPASFPALSSRLFSRVSLLMMMAYCWTSLARESRWAASSAFLRRNCPIGSMSSSYAVAACRAATARRRKLGLGFEHVRSTPPKRGSSPSSATAARWNCIRTATSTCRPETPPTWWARTANSSRHCVGGKPTRARIRLGPGRTRPGRTRSRNDPTMPGYQSVGRQPRSVRWDRTGQARRGGCPC